MCKILYHYKNQQSELNIGCQICAFDERFRFSLQIVMHMIDSWTKLDRSFIKHVHKCPIIHSHLVASKKPCTLSGRIVHRLIIASSNVNMYTHTLVIRFIKSTYTPTRPCSSLISQSCSSNTMQKNLRASLQCSQQTQWLERRRGWVCLGYYRKKEMISRDFLLHPNVYRC